MPTQLLEDVVVSSRDIYYLDTSAVLPLAYFKLDQQGILVPQREMRRAQRLFPLLDRIKQASAKARTSILALEEVAAKTRNGTRKEEIDKSGFSSWEDLKKSNGPLAREINQKAQQITLGMIKNCTQALKESGVLLEHVQMPESKTTERALEWREYFKDLLSKHGEIDPMDALHILWGLGLKSTGFISFDDAWSTVTGLHVIK